MVQGAFWGLMVGLVIGIARIAWENAYSAVECGEQDDRPAVIRDVHYLHFGIVLFAVVVTVTVCISLLTQPIDDKHASHHHPLCSHILSVCLSVCLHLSVSVHGA